ncbi:hypothetical protein [Vreelandella venusta]|uniref:hypothetical protein n=1 Tax=Vreelandella venusta TaxID=44935 RepID=UPI00200FDAED|nr:hypothetical protein [Halomonas venusta]UQI38788.1 hypothetical protein M3L73_11115 [Halomonas venusta]
MSKVRNDSHFLDPAIKYLGYKRFSLTVFLVLILTGAYLGLQNGNWFWLDKMAGVATVFGLLMTFTQLFDEGLNKHFANQRMSQIAGNDATMPVRPSDRKNASRVFCGIVISIIGAIISQFGSMLAPTLVNLFL